MVSRLWRLQLEAHLEKDGPTELPSEYDLHTHSCMARRPILSHPDKYTTFMLCDRTEERAVPIFLQASEAKEIGWRQGPTEGFWSFMLQSWPED